MSLQSIAFSLFALSFAFASEFPQGKIADTFATYGQVEEINRLLNPQLNELLHKTDFFGYYRLNLYEAQCPVSWGDAFPMCGNRACAVDTLEEEEIPEIWRASILGKVSGPIATHPSALPTPFRTENEDAETTAPLGGALGQDAAEMCIFERNGYDSERDYCIPEDETGNPEGVYVSLVNNPERFTGYSGEHAHAVWREIYRENCFEMKAEEDAEEETFEKSPDQVGPAMTDLEAVMLGRTQRQRVSGATLAQEYNQLQLENTCLEKRVFWRLISGMHTSVSTHLCWDYLNQTTGEWGPNVECFKSRVWNCPQWIENLYFNYVVVLRAVTKLSNYLDSYTYCSGDLRQDVMTKAKVQSLITKAQIAAPSFDESRMFDPNDPTIIGLKGEFRERFRNVSRIMDCVGCDKCRLWGKLQTSGYGTALKVLFEFDPENSEEFHLRRTELVSLIVTLQRLSHSIWAVGQFREMILHPKPSTPHSLLGRVSNYFSNVEFKPFGDAFDDEFEEIAQAVKFVLKSYISLPVNLWNTGMMFMTSLYDRYLLGETGIGKVRLNLDNIWH